MMFKLPESKDTQEEKKRQNDNHRVLDILSSVGAKGEPTDIRRLKTKDSEKRPIKIERPIRISFQSQAARDEALKHLIRAKKELQKSENTDDDNILKIISVRKDMTPIERQIDEELYKEVIRKREQSKQAGDDNAKWVVRNGKVVDVRRRLARREVDEGQE